MPSRDIIQIDEELCTGCGQCILDCAEGALELVDGKAKLVGEVYCDGLGACLGGCPTGALTIIKREADGFDEERVNERLAEIGREPLPAAGQAHAPAKPAGGCPGSASMQLAGDLAPAGGCPGHAAMSLAPAAGPGPAPAAQSTLGHWPIKLQLLNPAAPFLKNADLVLLADCAAASVPDLHASFLPGKAIALACPKLDNAEAHIAKLADLLKGATPRSVTTLIMEVPCCRGLDFIAREAIKRSGVATKLGMIVVGRNGKIIHKQNVA